MNAERKWTPGPWHPGHLGDDTTTCECAHVVDEGHAGGICTVHIDNGLRIADGGNDAPRREEAIANMHLIAAAPDMYEALKTLDSIERGMQGWHEDAKAEAWVKARAALSKAEGR